YSERRWPVDVLRRRIGWDEWARTQAGLEQRLQALNAFVGDVYGDQKIVADKVIPPDLLLRSPNFREECVGVTPALGVWAHICGSDLVRDDLGHFYVLEDNLRIPS